MRGEGGLSGQTCGGKVGLWCFPEGLLVGG